MQHVSAVQPSAGALSQKYTTESKIILERPLPYKYH